MIKFVQIKKFYILVLNQQVSINFHTKMDFNQLKAMIGKPTKEWTKEDVSNWLKYINLQVYIEAFNKKSIDGSCLKLLDMEDLTQQLGIKSRIICKKILIWLKFGLQQFDKYIADEQTTSIEQNSEQEEQPYIKTQIHQENNSISQVEMKSLEMQKSKKRKSEWEVLILKRAQGKQNIYYKFKQKNCRIGTDPNCEVLIPGQNVDLFHAHILFTNRGYLLHNLSSNSDIFIKVNSRMLISNGMESEMGSNIFKFYIDPERRIQIKIIEGKNQNTIYKFASGQNKIMIGRKSTNDISFSQDNTLSNLHAKITFSDHNWYIEDLATTNGTWIQLNYQLMIYTGLVFKLGTTNHQFQCELRIVKQGQDQEQRIRSEKLDTQACSICGQNLKNILFIPCNHCSVCEFCVANVKQCTICSQKIQDHTKIFKS